ncbi:MAG: hypothetical protein HY320_15240 [Armatimonadetes bacterium]|nr:hypothetical protein [Armatimonadota bacterium]
MRWSRSCQADSADIRRGWQRQRYRGRVLRLAAAAVALSGGMLAGCRAAPEFRRIYVRLPVLEALHPAWGQWRAVKRALAQAAQGPSIGRAPTAPPIVVLPPARRPEEPAMPDVPALEADATARWQAARPDPAPIIRERAAGEAAAEWHALRARIRQERAALLERHLREYVAAVQAMATEIGWLRVRIATLRTDAAGDPLGQSPARMRRRLALERELEALEKQRREELRQLLNRQAEELARQQTLPYAEFRRKWDAVIQQRLADAQRCVREEEARIRGSIPAPKPPAVFPSAPFQSGLEERQRLSAAMATTVRRSARVRARFQRAASDEVARLQREEKRLRELVRAEAEAAVRALAREQGMEPVFGGRAAALGLVDETARFIPLVRDYFAGRDRAP